MDIKTIPILLGINAVVVEFGWRVIHYAITGKGGVNDPFIMTVRYKGKHVRAHQKPEPAAAPAEVSEN